MYEDEHNGFYIETEKNSMVGEHWMYNIFLRAVSEPASAVMSLTSSYVPVKDFHVYHHVKYQLHNSICSWYIAKLLYLSILGMPCHALQKNGSINLQKILILICTKFNFISHFFLEIPQRFCKLVILGNLDMPGHAHQD